MFAFNASVARFISLATLTAAALVPLAVVIRGRWHVCPTVELILPHRIVAGGIVFEIHQTLHALSQIRVEGQFCYFVALAFHFGP